MLSLSPRFDLFRIILPREILSPKVIQKYNPLINKLPGVITHTVDYLNESIQGINFPGLTDLHIQQSQTSSNPFLKGNQKVEGATNVYYTSSGNILEKMDRSFTINFRLNQGLYNYFMIQETLYQYYSRSDDFVGVNDIILEILDESNKVLTKIKFIGCVMDGLEGLEFSYDKLERQINTFGVTFKFNNIKIEPNNV